MMQQQMTRTRPPGLVSCDHCRTPAYRIAGQALIIEHRHDGQKHTTVVPLQALLDKMQECSAQ